MKGRVRGEKIISVEEHGKDSAPGQHSNIHLCPCVLIFSTSAEEKNNQSAAVASGHNGQINFLVDHSARCNVHVATRWQTYK